MKHQVDDIEARRDRIAEHVRAILRELGEDPSREGLRETPQRVAKAMLHLTRGAAQTPERPPPTTTKSADASFSSTTGEFASVRIGLSSRPASARSLLVISSPLVSIAVPAFGELQL